jgi:hypothetical protein
MSLSPLPLQSQPTNGSSSAHASNSELANLLAKTFQEVDHLKNQLTIALRRAEQAERLLQASGSASASQSTIRDLEARLEKAEQARDEANARCTRIQDNWQDLEQWLVQIEARILENRIAFGKVVSEGGGVLSVLRVPLEFGSVPATNYSFAVPAIGARTQQPQRTSSSVNSRTGFVDLPLPPAPNPRIRQRSEGGEGYSGQPPPKKSRNDLERKSREERASFSESVRLFINLTVDLA